MSNVLNDYVNNNNNNETFVIEYNLKILGASEIITKQITIDLQDDFYDFITEYIYFRDEEGKLVSSDVNFLIRLPEYERQIISLLNIREYNHKNFSKKPTIEDYIKSIKPKWNKDKDTIFIKVNYPLFSLDKRKLIKDKINTLFWVLK